MLKYDKMKMKINNMNTQLKRKYFAEKLTQFQGDLKKTWKTTTKLLTKSLALQLCLVLL